MKELTKNLTLAAALTFAMATLGASLARADDAKPEAKPDNEVSYNVAIVSDYRYRGISQSRLDPALQGGADYTHNPTGLYAGTWLSTIHWIKDDGGSDNVEWDIYGGKRGEIVKDVSYDVGVLTYVYPSNDLSHVAGFANANTTEIYGQLGYGPAYVKYSLALTNLFGTPDSKNSGYLDLGANIDLSQGWTGNLHAGRQNVRNNGIASYTDWKVGVTKDFGFVTGALAVIGTNADKTFYMSPENQKFLGKTALVLNITKTF